MKFPKPTRRSTIKRRMDKAERDRITYVRAACVERDGHCRLAFWNSVEPCGGRSEWAHLEGHRRFETRGMTPEQRHATTWTMMLCKRHHDLYDARKLDIVFSDTTIGADGMIYSVTDKRSTR